MVFVSGEAEESEMTASRAYPAAAHARTARDMLGQALEALQADARMPMDVERVTEMIARAVGALFATEKSAADEPSAIAGVRQAMDYLGKTLEMLQNVTSHHNGISVATETIAKTLAILYPVAKAQERASEAPPPAEARASRTSMGPDSHPSRKSARVALEADVGFQSESNFYTGFSEDLSDGGVFLATFNLLKLHSPVTVTFTLPDGHLVVAQGRVAWVREYNETTPDLSPGMGVQFEGLSDADLRSIRSFLRKRAPMFYAD